MPGAWSDSPLVPVITLASEKRVTISRLTRILSNLQAILLRPSKTKSLVETIVDRYHTLFIVIYIYIYITL